MLLLLLVNYLLIYFRREDRGNESFFERGFENQLWIKISPSLHFFKIGLVFVLFDLEFLFLFLTYFSESWFWLFLLVVFMALTLWLELGFGSLNWVV